MISTAVIRALLIDAITATGLFEQVAGHARADLTEALETLRQHQASLAIIAPGEDEWLHETLPDDNSPLRAECRNRFEVLITARELDMDEDGVPGCVDLKDRLCEALLWAPIGPVPGADGPAQAILLPISAEPMILTEEDHRRDDHRRGREAWRVTLEARQTIIQV